MEAEKYEEQYRCYCRRAEELMTFYARHRYHLCNHVFHVSWLEWFGRAFGRFCRKLLPVM